MPARTATARGRARGGTRALQWVALLTAGTVILGLTFTLGILVGRQWSRPASSVAALESGARKTVPPGKRGGLSGTNVESAEVDQKQLTFYQTLTAPLGRAAADASQRHEERTKALPAPEPARGEALQPPPYLYASRGETVVGKPAVDSSAAADKAPTGPWSVQVAAFKSQAQADALQKQLRQSGFDAYVASAAGSDGQTNYRVRIGTFTSKAEAQRIAERVRGERSLAAFITPK
jgi:DedD protein